VAAYAARETLPASAPTLPVGRNIFFEYKKNHLLAVAAYAAMEALLASAPTLPLEMNILFKFDRFSFQLWQL
jgi:hypothetical protein